MFYEQITDSIMKKTQKLINLIEELEIEDDSVQTIDSSSMTLIEEDGKELDFDSEECQKLLQSKDTVEQFYEALGKPENVTLELCMVEVQDSVLDHLTKLFKNVEEF